MAKKRKLTSSSLDKIHYKHNEVLDVWQFEVVTSRGQVWLTSRKFSRKDSCVKSAMRFARRHRPFHIEDGNN